MKKKTSKPKILFLLQFPPPVHGSAIVGQYIKDSNAVNNTFDCHHLNIGISGNVNESGKIKIAKFFKYASIIFRLLKYLVVWRPVLCYLAITAYGTAFYKDLLLVTLVKLFRVKLVYHFHNKGIKNYQDFFVDDLLYRFAFSNVYIILLSKHLYTDIEKYADPQKVWYCANGIPDNIGSIPVECNNSSTVILFLSNMIESKGVFVLLDACAILKQRRVDFKCTFVGGWGNITKIQFDRKVKELDIETSVTYRGIKLGVEKDEVFRTSDIFVHPTYNDCFPLVVLEAMQYCKPVVSTFEGGIPDIIEDAVSGFLVPQKNAVMLADKLEMLVKNQSLRKQMGNAGRQRYDELFTQQAFETRLIKTLKSILYA